MQTIAGTFCLVGVVVPCRPLLARLQEEQAAAATVPSDAAPRAPGHDPHEEVPVGWSLVNPPPHRRPLTGSWIVHSCGRPSAAPGPAGPSRGRIPMLTRTRASLSPLRDTHGWPHTRDRPRPTGTRAPRVGRTASSSLPRQRRRGSESARVTIHPTRWLSPNTTPANQQPFHVQRKICARGTPPPSKAVGLLAGDASGRRRRGATTSAGIREGRAGGRRKVGTSRQQPVRRRQTEMKKCPSELQLEAFIRGSGEGAAESEPTGSGPSEPGGSGAFSPGGFGFGDTVSTAKPTANIMAALATETSPSLWI